MNADNHIDQFYLQQPEPIQSCLLALKSLILKNSDQLIQTWKYGMPFFYYNGKMFCYLWVHKKLNQPYIGFVEGKYLEHPALIQEKRARMKIILFDPNKNLPVATINKLLKQALALHQTKHPFQDKVKIR